VEDGDGPRSANTETTVGANRTGTRRRVIAAAAAVVLLDQLSKALALAYVGRAGRTIGPVDLVVV
jgi:hypothetical protein